MKCAFIGCDQVDRKPHYLSAHGLRGKEINCPSSHTSDPMAKSGTAPVHVPITVAKEMRPLGWPGLSHVEWVPLRKEESGQQRRGRDAGWVTTPLPPNQESSPFYRPRTASTHSVIIVLSGLLSAVLTCVIWGQSDTEWPPLRRAMALTFHLSIPFLWLHAL